jgi:hypothetical protein
MSTFQDISRIVLGIGSGCAAFVYLDEAYRFYHISSRLIQLFKWYYCIMGTLGSLTNPLG